jgi:hypothetical protein
MKSPGSIEEAEKKRKEDVEAKWDMIYMISAVMITVFVITFFMVSDLSTVELCITNAISSSLPGWLVLASTSPTTNSKNRWVSSSAWHPPPT